MKKLVAAALVTFASSMSHAGDIATTVIAEPVLSTQSPMGGSSEWIIPLLAIGMIVLAMSNQHEPEECK